MTATTPSHHDQTMTFTRHLTGARYIALTTFRKSGEPVTTPVWFALVGDRAYVMTLGGAGKLKRLRHTSRVQVAPCDFRGRSKATPLAAQATIIADPAESAAAERALSAKYGWQWRLLAWLERRRQRRNGTDPARNYLAITGVGV